MGKYMKNSKLKTTGKLPSTTTSSSSMGVRTRAKTLALQTLTNNNPPDNSSSYLQLRSRRLRKPPPLPTRKEVKQPAGDETERNPNMSSGHRVSSRLRRSSTKSEVWSFSRGDFDVGCGNLGPAADEELNNREGDFESSFGEYCLDFEPRRRTTRESTPCSAVRDFNIIEAHGSPTRSSKQSSAAPSPTRSPLPGINPTTQEIEDFFSSIECQEQQLFMDKYNFDAVNDKPLPGRFEWEQVRA